MSLNEQLAQKKAELVALKDQIEAGDADAIKSGAEITAAIEELNNSIDKAQKAQDMLAQIGEKAEEGDETMNEKTGIDSIIEQAKNVDISKKGWKVSGLLEKTATYQSVITGTQLTDYDKTVIGNTMKNRVSELFGAVNISGNALTFFQQGAWLGKTSTGTPDVVAEGAAKPQGSLTFTPVTKALKKIAGYVKETDEILWDAPFLASAVQNELLYQLMVVENADIMTDVLAGAGQSADYTSGQNTGDAANLVEGILYAKRLVAQNTPFQADFVAINPADMYDLMTAKDQNNQYLGGGYFQNAYGTGDYATPARVWGLPVFETSTVPAGTVLVGAGKQSVQIARKGGVMVNLYEQNEDDALKNCVTLLAEERLVTCVKYPNGLVKLTAATS